MFRPILLLCVLVLALLPTAAATTTVLLLKDGGTLEGELLNPQELSRKLYHIKTADGIEISLDFNTVERVQGRERDALVEYNTRAPLSDNTVENHLYWAKWCSEQQLPEQAKVHWQQIIELDPDHAEARRILGYTKTASGNWESLRDKRANKGLIEYKGRWRTPYEIEVENYLTEQKETEQHWRQTIRTLCQRLPQTEAELRSIRVPAAFPAIRDLLIDKRVNLPPQTRILLLQMLVQMPDARSLRFVAGWSVRPDEPSEEIRQMCVDALLKRAKEQPEVRHYMIAVYRSVLNPKTHPAIINLAAETLARIGGVEAVPELIEVLEVTVAETIQPPTPTYSGGGINQPGKAVTVQRKVRNPVVLSALQTLTGMNFDFDQAAWRNKYRESLRSPAVNLRRI